MTLLKWLLNYTRKMSPSSVAHLFLYLDFDNAQQMLVYVSMLLR